MAGTQVNPTRMELTRLKKKLVTAVRGHKLLKDKRDELMRQFLDRVRENKALREEVETALNAANGDFMLARAGMPDEMLNTALLAPKQEVSISAGTQNVMSVEIPDFDFKTRTPDPNDIYSYGFAFTTDAIDWSTVQNVLFTDGEAPVHGHVFCAETMSAAAIDPAAPVIPSTAVVW